MEQLIMLLIAFSVSDYSTAMLLLHDMLLLELY